MPFAALLLPRRAAAPGAQRRRLVDAAPGRVDRRAQQRFRRPVRGGLERVDARRERVEHRLVTDLRLPAGGQRVGARSSERHGSGASAIVRRSSAACGPPGS
jgi:hypothetical protein